MTAVNEQGMMDIGQHCAVCRKLDFLPYTCPKCGETFCSDHRQQYNEHPCIVEMERKKNVRPKVNTSHLPPASTLFPDLDKLRNDANAKARDSHGHRLGGSTKPTSSALSTAEFAIQRLRKLLGKPKKSGGLFKRTKSSPVVEMARLRKAAKGDPKVASAQRCYINCIYCDNDTHLGETTPLYVSKMWPVGRMLDSCTDLMGIRNINNRVTDKSQRLTVLRKGRAGEPELVPVAMSGRVAKELKDGDTVYIVRGEELP